MKIELKIAGQTYKADLSKGIDISIPLSPNGPRAWYVDPISIEPVVNDQFTGSVALGGSVNFRHIHFNPHGHGTHTETVGHIDEEVLSINKTLTRFFFKAELITIEPKPFAGKESEFVKHGDLIITREAIEAQVKSADIEALVIRTMPNSDSKLSQNYSNTNPAYFEPEALAWMRDLGIKHLLTDLPSVDRENDGGKLLAHRAFWHGGRSGDGESTITEMVYIKNEVSDGDYLLNLQIAPFENDASPSKPVLYALSI